MFLKARYSGDMTDVNRNFEKHQEEQRRFNNLMNLILFCVAFLGIFFLVVVL